MLPVCWIDQFPNAKCSADISAHRACCEDGIKAAPSGMRDKGHNGNEKPCSESRSDEVHGSKGWIQLA